MQRKREVCLDEVVCRDRLWGIRTKVIELLKDDKVFESFIVERIMGHDVDFILKDFVMVIYIS